MIAPTWSGGVGQARCPGGGQELRQLDAIREAGNRQGGTRGLAAKDPRRPKTLEETWPRAVTEVPVPLRSEVSRLESGVQLCAVKLPRRAEPASELAQGWRLGERPSPWLPRVCTHYSRVTGEDPLRCLSDPGALKAPRGGVGAGFSPSPASLKSRAEFPISSSLKVYDSAFRRRQALRGAYAIGVQAAP